MANFDSAVIDQIQARSAVASESELYAGIAESLPDAERAQVARAASLLPDNVVAIGKNFYIQRLRPLIEDVICSRFNYCENRKHYDTATEIVSLVAESVAEALAKAHGIPEEAAKLGGKLMVETSAAVMKEGLNSLCRCA